MSLEPFRIGGLIRCPCVKYKCLHFFGSEDVKAHLYKKEFMDNYFVWTSHGEIDGSDCIFHNVVIGESSWSVGNNIQHLRYHEMVADAFGMHFNFETHESVEQPSNEEAKYFYEQLEAASRPLREGSMHSQLSVAVRLLSIKSDTNISQEGMDSFIGLMSELVDSTFNIPEDFYKAKILVFKLGLSSMRNDCCEDGCMSYYKGDADLESCKFYEKPHFKRLSSGKKAAVKSMHYLPLIPRLKRWGSLEAFDRTYPDYASEPRNVRLGLCADGFTPFSVSATPYSCWPFLPVDHEFRKMKNAFKKNTVEHDLSPPIYSGEEIWERVQNFTKVTEAPPSRFPGYGVTHNWTKQSIFWELPYWKDNLLRYNLDVMHVEKEYFDNLFNTMIDDKNKTKDDPKARLDLQEYCRRPELHLQSGNNGGEGNQDRENDYYDVIKEILELSYSGWPNKKIILFRCKWFDPTPRRGTNVHSQYNIIEVNKKREYDHYDPFIIAKRVRQVYYAPYPLRRDKADWLVVIKTKPVGRVEVENVLDVAYQNNTSSVNQMVDD
ncbi:uncharacterized protein LOC142179877 [Nicotiana tabacum]|uniref:Uncharacterized protein LOC142179877 n=1 Tax=Nicotiana tabacum TaxID=4097 RepID=A0AC58UBK5_TOBAC